jgi:hypothetical protein
VAGIIVRYLFGSLQGGHLEIIDKWFEVWEVAISTGVDGFDEGQGYGSMAC